MPITWNGPRRIAGRTAADGCCSRRDLYATSAGVAVPWAEVIASESTPAYAPEPAAVDDRTSTSPSPGNADDGATVDDALQAMSDSISAALAIEHDALGDPQIRAAITTVQRSYDQLAMLRASLVATLQRRATDRAPRHAKQKSQGEGARFLREELHLTPAEAKQTSETGRQLDSNDRTRQAWQAGDVGQAQAAVIGRALRQVEPEHRDDLEVELLEAAARVDAVALGRLARRRVGECTPHEAVRADRQRHVRRRASVRQDEHGDVFISGSFSGTAGETILASWRAFCDKPTRKDERSQEQRGADAFEAMALAALRAGEAPTQHGERPHVIVIVKQEDLLRNAGMAELAHTGPVPVESIGHLLRDSVMTHVGVDAQNAPIAVTTRVRSVPLGLWRALIVRDGGCTWEGCSAPVGWCDVAHGEHPYDRDGRLSPSNAALLCRRHHRRFDHGRWKIEVRGNEVTYRHPGHDPPNDPGGPPAGGSSGRPPDDAGGPPASGTSGRPPDDPGGPPASGPCEPGAGGAALARYGRASDPRHGNSRGRPSDGSADPPSQTPQLF